MESVTPCRKSTGVPLGSPCSRKGRVRPLESLTVFSTGFTVPSLSTLVFVACGGAHRANRLRKTRVPSARAPGAFRRRNGRIGQGKFPEGTVDARKRADAAPATQPATEQYVRVNR